MTARRTQLAANACLVGFVILASASPAFAQATGGTGSLGTFIQNIIDLLNNNIIRGLAVLAIIFTGGAWLLGHLDMRRAATVALGIVVMFSAAAIVDMITGGGTGG